MNTRQRCQGLRKLLALLLPLALLGCGHNKILEFDSHTGRFVDFATGAELPNLAIVTINKEIDIDKLRSLIVVPDHVSAFVVPSKKDFTLSMIKQLRYFNEAVSISQLRDRLDEAGTNAEVLSRALSTGSEFAIIQAMAAAYRPFLWLRWAHRKSIKGLADSAYQLILTDGYTLEDYFVVETPYHYTSTGPQDKARAMTQYRKNQYPMLNAFIDYLRQHSSFYLHHIPLPEERTQPEKVREPENQIRSSDLPINEKPAIIEERKPARQ